MGQWLGGLDQVLRSLGPSELKAALSCLRSLVVKSTDRGCVDIGDEG